MYALVATHNAALRSAVLVLLRVCHPGCHVVLANDVADMHEALESGCCDTMVVDTQFTGYGRDFDAAMLRACYPRVNVLPLGGAGGSQAMLGALQRGLDAADYDAAPLPAPSRAMPPGYRMRAGAAMGWPQPAAAVGPALTGRQRDVLHLLGEGRSTKDIARRLGLAVPTVKTHLAAIYRELGARNRVEAVVKAGMPLARAARAHQPMPAAQTWWPEAAAPVLSGSHSA